MKSYKRIIAGFLAIATLSVNIITASAELSSEPAKVSFMVRWLHSIAVRSDGMKVQDIPIGRFLASMVSDLSHGTVCEFSDDHWHHADESDYVKVSEGKDGTYSVRAKCQYCYKEFAVGGLTADDLSSKYNDYVSSLPASGYDSAGKLLWQPRWIEDTSVWGLYFGKVINSTIDGYVCSDAKTAVSVSGTQITVGFLAQDGSHALSLRADCTSGVWHLPDPGVVAAAVPVLRRTPRPHDMKLRQQDLRCRSCWLPDAWKHPSVKTARKGTRTKKQLPRESCFFRGLD